MLIPKKAQKQAVTGTKPSSFDFDDFARFFRSIDNTLPMEAAEYSRTWKDS